MRFAWALVCFSLTMAQSIPSDEIRSNTVPYVPSTTLRTEVRMVEVPAVVRDGKGRPVAGLTRDGFNIYDEGKKQTIAAFSVESSHARGAQAGAAPDEHRTDARPRFLALCFDDLHLLAAALQPVKDAAQQFVRTRLAPDDRVAVVTTARAQTSVFSADVPLLLEQISRVTPASEAAEDRTPCPRIRPYEAYQIANQMDPGDLVLKAKVGECEACTHGAASCPSLTRAKAQAIWDHTRSGSMSTLGVIDRLVDGAAKLPGERVILLTSAGFLMGTLEGEVDRLMDKARHAGVVINSLEVGGDYLSTASGTSDDGRAVLASGTGGAFFHNDNDLERGFRDLGMAPETRYLLSFTPPAAPDGRFHKIKVQLTAAKGYSMEARLGYLARAAEEPAQAKLDSEVMASENVTDLPVSFTWEQWTGRPGITVVAHLDIAHLHFKPFQERRTQQLTIAAVVLDAHGGFVAGKRSELQLSLREATFQQLAAASFPVAMTIQVPPGSYSVRAVVQEAVEGKLAAASAVIEIK